MQYFSLQTEQKSPLGRVHCFAKDWQKSEMYSGPYKTSTKLFLLKAPT